jgi:predicted PurR-regulated permease PerM
MTTPEKRLARWRTTAYLVWSIIGMVVLLAAAGWAIGRISAALIPFIIGFIIAFLLHNPVSAMERRGASRAMAVVVCFLIGIAVLVVAGIFLFPPLGRELEAFATQVPVYLEQAGKYLQEQQDRFSQFVVPGWLENALQSVVSSIGSYMSSLAEAAGRIVLAAGSGVVVGFFDLFIGIVVAFWLLKDMPTMQEELVRLAGPRFKDDAENVLTTVDHMVGGYLKGQTIASLATGAIVTVGLAIIGVPYALVLGLVTFVFNYIPYIGPFVAGVAAAVVGLFVSPLTALLAIVIVIAAQQLVDTLLTPRVMSAQVNLHPTLVIFALLVGGTLFGIVGMLLAIPFAATGKGLFVYYYERRTKRQLESEDGALFRSATSDDEASEPSDREQSSKPDGADKDQTG